MPIHEQYYLTCGNCGIGLKEDGEVAYAGSPEELLELADDEGWLIDHQHKLHVCPDCLLDMNKD